MRRTQGRNTYYAAFCLRDGTVTSALPMRKLAKRIMKRDHLRADADNVIIEYVSSGKELLTIDLEHRVRFLDIIATSLNCRRALRQVVLPRLAAIDKELVAIRKAITALRREHSNAIAFQTHRGRPCEAPGPGGRNGRRTEQGS